MYKKGLREDTGVPWITNNIKCQRIKLYGHMPMEYEYITRIDNTFRIKTRIKLFPGSNRSKGRLEMLWMDKVKEDRKQLGITNGEK